MTLDEAIKHCLEVARTLQDKADTLTGEESRNCMDCSSDHIQLAEWLTELKGWKENPFWQIKTECKKNYDCNNCAFLNHCPFAHGNSVASEYPMDWIVY